MFFGVSAQSGARLLLCDSAGGGSTQPHRGQDFFSVYPICNSAGVGVNTQILFLKLRWASPRHYTDCLKKIWTHLNLQSSHPFKWHERGLTFPPPDWGTLRIIQTWTFWHSDWGMLREGLGASYPRHYTDCLKEIWTHLNLQPSHPFKWHERFFFCICSLWFRLNVLTFPPPDWGMLRIIQTWTFWHSDWGMLRSLLTRSNDTKEFFWYLRPSA